MAPHFRMKTLLSRHRFEALALGLAVLFCALHVWVNKAPVIGTLGQERQTPLLVRAAQIAEGRATDLQFALRGPRPAHPDVVVVAVDEKSAQKYGLWPWPRDLLARGIDRLREAGVKAVGLDMIFADEVVDRQARAYQESLQELDKALEQAPESAPALGAYRDELRRRAAISADAMLAAALARSPQVVQGAIVYDDSDRQQFASKAEEWKRQLEPHLIREFQGEVPKSSMDVDLATLRCWSMESAQLPLPLFAQASERLGFFNIVRGSGRHPAPRAALRPATGRRRGCFRRWSCRRRRSYLGSTVEPVVVPSEHQLTGARLRPPDGQPLSQRVPARGRALHAHQLSRARQQLHHPEPVRRGGRLLRSGPRARQGGARRRDAGGQLRPARHPVQRVRGWRLRPRRRALQHPRPGLPHPALRRRADWSCSS